MTWKISCMMWRIGDILDFDAQLDGIYRAGFEAVSFHASPGNPGKWRGVDPAATDKKARRRLRDQLSAFSMCEIHAPFSYALGSDGPPNVVDLLRPVIEFAGDVGASILTVHGDPPAGPESSDYKPWHDALERLNEMAEKNGVVIGLELMRGFEGLSAPRRFHIGVTLDVGHMYLDEGAGYLPYQTIGGLIRSLGDVLVHLHVHDYDGTYDHIEAGTGRVDFDEVLRSLSEMDYKGTLCLELNPDRVSPEGIRRSADFLRTKIGALRSL